MIKKGKRVEEEGEEDKENKERNLEQKRRIRQRPKNGKKEQIMTKNDKLTNHVV